MQRSTSTAYGLWLLLGSFGAHRFYVGQHGVGATMLVLACVGTGLSSFAGGWLSYAGAAALAAGYVWSVVDAKRLKSWVQARNAAAAAPGG